MDGEEISPPSQVPTFPLQEGNHSPSSPRIDYLLCVCEVCTSITFTTHLHHFLLSFCRTQSQDCLLGNTIRETHVISHYCFSSISSIFLFFLPFFLPNSCYFSVFHTIVFLLLLVFLFFSPLSLPFFPSVEQTQRDCQKTAKL